VENGAVEVLVRPQDVRVVAAAPEVLCGTVRHVQFVGHASHLEIDTGAGRLIASCTGEAPAVGEAIGVAPHDGRDTPRLFASRPAESG
jgi:ABC-type Fe3+/spermidine/putrescine transport system ATPase subunit